jgi:hypothetical protein
MAVCPTYAESGDGVSVIEAALTVSVALPDFPARGAVAVMVATPTPTPVAVPVEETVATPGLLEVQTNACPARTLPCASLAVAVNGAVSPARMVFVAGATVTVAIGTTTVIVDVPFLPSLVAVIVALPAVDVALTRPVGDTVATDGLFVVQVTVLPVRTPPTESSVSAVNCSVAFANSVSCPG